MAIRKRMIFRKSSAIAGIPEHAVQRGFFPRLSRGVPWESSRSFVPVTKDHRREQAVLPATTSAVSASAAQIPTMECTQQVRAVLLLRELRFQLTAENRIFPHRDSRYVFLSPTTVMAPAAEHH